MELLKNWIEPLVATAISQSADKNDPNLRPRELKTTVDDGKNFRIPVTRPKYAQLLEVLTSPLANELYQLLISCYPNSGYRKHPLRKLFFPIAIRSFLPDSLSVFVRISTGTIT